jgi:hypothetical protein
MAFYDLVERSGFAYLSRSTEHLNQRMPAGQGPFELGYMPPSVRERCWPDAVRGSPPRVKISKDLRGFCRELRVHAQVINK